MRNRGSVVLIQNHEVALIRRNWNGKIYYVFPGGGIEKGETPKQAAKREAYEELGVQVSIGDLLTILDSKGKQYYFYADIVSGEFGTGQGEEFSNTYRGTYEPLWVPIKDFPSLDIRPPKVAEMILHSEF